MLLNLFASEIDFANMLCPEGRPYTFGLSKLCSVFKDLLR
ncbi:protein of unknown function [Latilactobacillus sakei]|nr:protein of unknown function [Latilactobacillus sakei]